MAWYNKACYLSMLNQVPDSLEALKRSIEIDVKNARKAVKDKDFVNVRSEEGFKRIIEVVLIESLRQGYHTIGSIVWTTFLGKEDTIKGLDELILKGIVVKNEKRQGLNQIIPIYDLVPDVCNTIWAFEGRCILNIDQPTERCLTAWQEAWEKFEAKQELF